MPLQVVLSAPFEELLAVGTANARTVVMSGMSVQVLARAEPFYTFAAAKWFLVVSLVLPFSIVSTYPAEYQGVMERRTSALCD